MLREGEARAYADDAFRDGTHTFVLDNGLVRAIVSADAGARAFVFEDLASGKNVFTPIGALRDDVESPLPVSARDYIGKYTHPFPAGTFNRPYQCTVERTPPNAALLCAYTAPDLAAKPVHFEKEFVLAPNARVLRVRVRADTDARSISAVMPLGSHPQTPYNVFTVDYHAGEARWLTFSTTGPPAATANPGGSP